MHRFKTMTVAIFISAGALGAGSASASDDQQDVRSAAQGSRARVTIIDPATMTTPLQHYKTAGSAGSPPIARYQHDATSEGHSMSTSSGMPATSMTTTVR